MITTLQHELCHLWNIQQEVQDTSRKGQYHNACFREVAEARGLIVKQSQTYGWCITEPSPAFTELVLKNCRAGCFKLERLKTYKDGTPKVTKPGEDGSEKTITRTKQSYKKFVCPECGQVARAAAAANLICGNCNQEMAVAAN